MVTIGRTAPRAATVAALTDSTGGTANDTLQPVTGLMSGLSSVDISDWNTNSLPRINDNFADLSAKINEIRTVLRNAGLMA